MFDRIQALFHSLTAGHSAAAIAPDDPRIAVAALCIQVMEVDGAVSDTEKKRLRKLLRQHYEVEGRTLDALIAAGEERGNEAVDYFRFTSTLKRHLDESQRLELVDILWDIVYADGARSEMEDHVIRRIADLLGVPGSDRMAKLHEAEEGDAV